LEKENGNAIGIKLLKICHVAAPCNGARDEIYTTCFL